ncbi:MAG: transposase [Candidatus Omnitrophota bacterium]
MRIVVAGGMYHIMQRGNNAGAIFVDDVDRKHFLHILKKTKDKFNIAFFAFCLMDNHIHILMRINKENLGQAMHWLFMRYAIWFNARHKRKGHLFMARFKSILCTEEKYFLKLIQYIHVNPVKAGLASNPFDYQWSSANLFLKKDLWAKSFLEVEFIMRMFDKDNNKSIELYKTFLLNINVKTLTYPRITFGSLLGKCNKKIRAKLGSAFLKKSIRTEEIKSNVCLRDDKIYQLDKNGMEKKDICEILKISNATFYRALRRRREK